MFPKREKIHFGVSLISIGLINALQQAKRLCCFLAFHTGLRQCDSLMCLFQSPKRGPRIFFFYFFLQNLVDLDPVEMLSSLASNLLIFLSQNVDAPVLPFSSFGPFPADPSDRGPSPCLSSPLGGLLDAFDFHNLDLNMLLIRAFNTPRERHTEAIHRVNGKSHWLTLFEFRVYCVATVQGLSRGGSSPPACPSNLFAQALKGMPRAVTCYILCFFWSIQVCCKHRVVA